MTKKEAVDIIKTGGVLIYPTETLFAIGSDAMDERAAIRVARIKGRPVSKPLPLIIGSMEQLDLVTDFASAELLKLASQFWPGPLSILVRARAELPSAVKDARGFTSVRWSNHPFASDLCIKSRTPIIATSANMSGKKAAARIEEIDKDLSVMVEGLYDGEPGPRGGKPSTVVEPIVGGKVRILREGVISKSALIGAGFKIVS